MRERLSMDFAWRFHADNLEYSQPKEMMYYYHHSKAERGRGPAGANFYDLDWQIVDLPHDYAVDSSPDFTTTSAHGFIRRYNAWYRRLFDIDKSDKGKRILIQFDGVATHCKVWVNGHLMHRNFCGYTSFFFDVSDVLNYGTRPNVISVYVDTSDFEGWWYEGAGIYRHVWMIKTSDMSVDQWGTFVNPQLKEGKLWDVNIETKLKNVSYEDRRIKFVSQIIDASGKVASEGSQDEIVEAHEELSVKTLIPMENPALWSLEETNLYILRSVILENGVELDTYETTFGFRTLLYKDDGFYLNGKYTKFKGVCAHDDQANLGVAIPDDVKVDRIKMIKFMGCNAYRCSHNPPAPEILDLCDRLGLLVMDETRWFDSSDEALDQLRSMMIRDRNHPCIVMWSMGNEEPIQGIERGRFIMKNMVHTAHKLDVSRPSLFAMNGGILSHHIGDESDLLGINYNEEIYDKIHESFPGRLLVAAEIGSCHTPEGYWEDASGYDWEKVDIRPYFCGMFKWAAFAYRGESRAWPRLISRSGLIEANLVPKENTWFYKQMWDEKDIFVKIYPYHWNLDGMEGEKITIKVYSNLTQVELFLNGKSLGKKDVNVYRRTEYDVIYERGELKAVAYDKGGKKICEDILVTTGGPVKIVLTPSRSTIKANRTDVITLAATVMDKDGNTAVWPKSEINFEVSGPATILAVSNSDPYEQLGAKVPRRRLHNGVCHLVLRTTTIPGEIAVKATSEGMETTEFSIRSETCERVPHVPIDIITDGLVRLICSRIGDN